MGTMKRSDNKALQQAAHLYVAATEHFESADAGRVRDKSIATMRLQVEALKYAADTMEHWTSMMLDSGDQYIVCAPGVAQLREIVMDGEMIIRDMEARNA